MWRLLWEADSERVSKLVAACAADTSFWSTRVLRARLGGKSTSQPRGSQCRVVVPLGSFGQLYGVLLSNELRKWVDACVRHPHGMWVAGIARIRGRSSGSLTGSRLAGAAARIPVETAFEDVAARVRPLALDLGEDCQLTLASYVDNLFAVGPSAWAATEALELVAAVLKDTWGLQIKAESREAMAPRGSQEWSGEWAREGWPLRAPRRPRAPGCLGRRLAAMLASHPVPAIAQFLGHRRRCREQARLPASAPEDGQPRPPADV